MPYTCYHCEIKVDPVVKDKPDQCCYGWVAPRRGMWGDSNPYAGLGGTRPGHYCCNCAKETHRLDGYAVVGWTGYDQHGCGHCKTRRQTANSPVDDWEREWPPLGT